MEYGLQLYSVRDITEQHLEDALKAVAEIGYKTVEFAGFFGHTPEQINSMLNQYGLRVSGTHTGWQEVAEHFDETVAYHKAIGNTEIIIPGADLSTKEKLDAFVEMVNKFQPLLAAEGICLHYHNHDFEFKANEDGIIPYHELVERTQLYLEIDTYWAYAGKQDPLEMMDRLKDRVKVIHVKDGAADGEGTPLGQGTAPVAAVWKKAAESGVAMVVESETLKPDGITEAKICFDYLKQLEK